MVSDQFSGFDSAAPIARAAAFSLTPDHAALLRGSERSILDRGTFWISEGCET